MLVSFTLSLQNDNAYARGVSGPYRSVWIKQAERGSLEAIYPETDPRGDGRTFGPLLLSVDLSEYVPLGEVEQTVHLFRNTSHSLVTVAETYRTLKLSK